MEHRLSLLEPEVIHGEETIVSLLARQANLAPGRVAVRHGDHHLTFGAMVATANRVAHSLNSRGIGPGKVVALCLERSLFTAPYLFGILKTGAAFAAIDPLYPKERIQLILAQAEACLVLTQASHREVFTGETPLLDEAAFRVSLNQWPSTPPACFVAPQSLAYIIFTSGSTGRPKGILMAHETVVSRQERTQSLHEFRAGDRFLQIANLSFDMAIWEFFVPLLSGSQVVICDPQKLADLHDLALFIETSHITIARFVPPMLDFLLRGDRLSHCRCLRRVITGGDKMSFDLMRRFAATLTADLYNQYGPSERPSSISWCCRPEKRLTSVPIGRPLAGTRVNILDRHQQRVPIGAPGELYLGGDGLALGYLDRPGLTAERFVCNPFSSQPGSRYYRSGDLARFRYNGTLEFLGRIDFQVKIRGQRVETGDIEHHLCKHEQVNDAVVCAREVKGDRELVAYVVCSQPLSARQVRAHLSERLPGFMVPSYVVFLDRLPLSPNGKVDRLRLPPPESGQRQTDLLPEAPRNRHERDVLAIWQEVLGLPDIGIDDNFFQLGGHSLMATQLTAKLRRTLGVTIALRDVFATPTVRRMAERLPQMRYRTEGRLPLRGQVRPPTLPASFAQKRLWILDRMSGPIANYNITKPFRLRGLLAAKALECSIDLLTQRQQSLRTRFRGKGEDLLQVVVPYAAQALPMCDLSGLAEDVAELTAQRLVMKRSVAPFDLERGPLFQTVLLRIRADRHVLVMHMHHIIADGWSIGVLIDSVRRSYDAFLNNREPSLPGLPVQYADYSLWQRQWCAGPFLENQVDWWRAKLRGAPESLALPYAGNRRRTVADRGLTLPFRLNKQVTAGLENLARSNDATLYMIVVAALADFLCRYSGDRDLCIGTPTSGRDHPDLEHLVGFFINTLVLRLQPGRGGHTVGSLLAHAREEILGAWAHQDVPFERLVRALAPARQDGGTPFFQVMFVMQNPMETHFTMPGLGVDLEEPTDESAKFDLTLDLCESADGLEGKINFNRELFHRRTAQGMADHLAHLLDAYSESKSDTPLAFLTMMCTEARSRLLRQWQDNRPLSASRVCISRQFSRVAAQRADAVAVNFEHRILTYGCLAEEARQIAGSLADLGIGPESRVVVLAARGIEMLTGLLGTLMVGAAYVPLDPEAPTQRLNWMLGDIQPDAVLTTSEIRGMLVLPTGVAILTLDLGSWRDAPMGEICRFDPARLAYILYTSGSTGRPKGIAVTHDNVLRLFSQPGLVDFGSESVWLQFAPATFDAATLEIWGALLHGARLVLAPSGIQGLAGLPALIRERGVTHLWLTAALFHQFIDEDRDALKRVQCLLAGGDVLDPAVVRRTLNRYSQLTLINGYGPTENTTFTCTYSMTASTEIPSSVPIGRPIAHTGVYLLNCHGQPVPAGVTGDLFTDGLGLARGYWRKPAQTAWHWLPNPFAKEPGQRMYRTGDLATHRDDGTLMFLGRRDHQVKIRGFRVELGEIESLLAAETGVAQSAVIADGNRGVSGLHAYLELKPGEQISVRKLKANLQRHLPHFMIPGNFTIMEKLPRTTNGKLDRRLLPQPIREEPAGYRPAADGLELKLQKIWEEILEFRPIGTEDNFFDKGGHSLAAVRLVSHCAKVFKRRLPVERLFQNPTIAGMAALLGQEGAAPSWSALVPLQPLGEGAPLFCVHPGAGHATAYIALAHRLGKSRPVIGIQARGLGVGEIPEQQVEDMAASYVAAMVAFQKKGPYHLFGWSSGGTIALEMAQQLSRRGTTVASLILADTTCHYATRQSRDLSPVLKWAQIVAPMLQIPADDLVGKDESALLQTILEQGRLLGLFPSWYQLLDLDRAVAYLDHHRSLIRRYLMRPYVGNMTLIRARDSHGQRGVNLNWQPWIEGRFNLLDCPGRHESLCSEPHVTALARLVKVILSESS